MQQIDGTVKLPGSKSVSNRILLLAALADGTTEIENLLVRTSRVHSSSQSLRRSEHGAKLPNSRLLSRFSSSRTQ